MTSEDDEGGDDAGQCGENVCLFPQANLVGKIALAQQVQLDLARSSVGGMTQNGYRQRDNSGENCSECDNGNCHDDGDGDGDGDDDDDTLFHKQTKMMSL